MECLLTSTNCSEAFDLKKTVAYLYETSLDGKTAKMEEKLKEKKRGSCEIRMELLPLIWYIQNLEVLCRRCE